MESFLTGHEQIHRLTHELGLVTQQIANNSTKPGPAHQVLRERLQFLMVLLLSVPVEEIARVAGNCTCDFMDYWTPLIE